MGSGGLTVGPASFFMPAGGVDGKPRFNTFASMKPQVYPTPITLLVFQSKVASAVLFRREVGSAPVSASAATAEGINRSERVPRLKTWQGKVDLHLDGMLLGLDFYPGGDVDPEELFTKGPPSRIYCPEVARSFVLSALEHSRRVPLNQLVQLTSLTKSRSEQMKIESLPARGMLWDEVNQVRVTKLPVFGTNFTYIPQANNLVLPDEFGFRLVSGCESLQLCSVMIDVVPVNDPPVATDLEFSGSFAIPFHFAGVDAERDPFRVFTAGDPASVGRFFYCDVCDATCAGNKKLGTERFSPNQTFCYLPSMKVSNNRGQVVLYTATLSYRVVSNGNVESNNATVTFRVMNPAMPSTEIVIDAVEDSATTFNLDQHLPGITSLSVVQPPQHGSLSSFVNRTATYKPGSNFFGKDFLTIQVTRFGFLTAPFPVYFSVSNTFDKADLVVRQLEVVVQPGYKAQLPFELVDASAYPLRLGFHLDRFDGGMFSIPASMTNTSSVPGCAIMGCVGEMTVSGSDLANVDVYYHAFAPNVTVSITLAALRFGEWQEIGRAVILTRAVPRQGMYTATKRPVPEMIYTAIAIVILLVVVAFAHPYLMKAKRKSRKKQEPEETVEEMV
jgi:hypothetical protein